MTNMLGKLRHSTGSALVDYILPTAVVGVVVGFGLFTIFKDDLLSNFISASTNAQVQDGVLAMTSLGDSGGTSGLVSDGGTEDETSGVPADLGEITDPATSCSGGMCTMSFKGVSLTGIPEDFAEFIETSGPASGTHSIASILKQVADIYASDATGDNDALGIALHKLASDCSIDIPWINGGPNNGIAHIQQSIETDLSDGSYDDTFLLSMLKEGSSSKLDNTKAYYNEAITEIQSLTPSPETEKVEALVNLLYGQVQNINSTFVNDIDSNTYNLDQIKAHIASSSTDIRAQLINILGE